MKSSTIVGLAGLVFLVGGSYSAYAGAKQACHIAPPGGANRSAGCTKPAGGGCIGAAPCGGTCKVGAKGVAVDACNGWAEANEEYCKNFPCKSCDTVGTLKCLTFTGFVNDPGNCTSATSCALWNTSIDCTTVL